jgi:hypothetical protein
MTMQSATLYNGSRAYWYDKTLLYQAPRGGFSGCNGCGPTMPTAGMAGAKEEGWSMTKTAVGVAGGIALFVFGVWVVKKARE